MTTISHLQDLEELLGELETHSRWHDQEEQRLIWKLQDEISGLRRELGLPWVRKVGRTRDPMCPQCYSYWTRPGEPPADARQDIPF